MTSSAADKNEELAFPGMLFEWDLICRISIIVEKKYRIRFFLDLVI